MLYPQSAFDNCAVINEIKGPAPLSLAMSMWSLGGRPVALWTAQSGKCVALAYAVAAAGGRSGKSHRALGKLGTGLSYLCCTFPEGQMIVLGMGRRRVAVMGQNSAMPAPSQDAQKMCQPHRCCPSPSAHDASQTTWREHRKPFKSVRGEGGKTYSWDSASYPTPPPPSLAAPLLPPVAGTGLPWLSSRPKGLKKDELAMGG